MVGIRPAGPLRALLDRERPDNGFSSGSTTVTSAIEHYRQQKEECLRLAMAAIRPDAKATRECFAAEWDMLLKIVEGIQAEVLGLAPVNLADEGASD